MIIDRRILIVSLLSGLYLVLLLNGELPSPDSVLVGVAQELFTIPAIIVQVAIFLYEIYNLCLKHRRITVYSAIPICIFAVLFVWVVAAG